MDFRVCLENGCEGKTLAWVIDHPGCFITAESEKDVLEVLPEAIRDYALWVSAHEKNSWVDTKDIRITVDETWQVYTIDADFELAQPDGENYDVNAWFRHDWKPLSHEDIERGFKLLAWSREDFLSLVQGLNVKELDFKPEGERWSIKGIIRHAGVAEWWYQDRLNLACPYEALPKDPFETIVYARKCLLDLLPSFENKSQVIGVDGEFWSPRKLLRRTVWHERDHTNHIRKLLKLPEIQ